jgi:hypothetical protein
VRSLLKQNWPLVLALVITTITQITYWVAKPELGNCYDCGEYQDLANFISREPKNLISDFRPPLYPLFLVLIGLDSPNPQGDLNLFVAQSLMLLVSLGLFWSILKGLKAPNWLQAIPILLLSASPAFYSFTKFKLTETTNMLLLLAIIKLILELKNKFSLKLFGLWLLLINTAIFTRFANSYLVVILGVFLTSWWWKQAPKRETLLRGFLIIITAVLPQILYAAANYHRNYYFGLSGETGTNLLGKLVQYKLIPKEDPAFPKIVSNLNGCTGLLASSDVFTCVWNYLPKNSFVSKYSVENSYVDAFTRKYILLNTPEYLVKSALVTVEAISKPADMYLVLSKTPGLLFDIEKGLAKTVHWLLLAWVVTVLPIFVVTRRRVIIGNHSPLIFVSIIICAYYLAITGLAAINDYQRIITPALPLFYLLMTVTTYKLVKTNV